MPTEERYKTKDAARDAVRYGGTWALRHTSEELRADPEVVIAAAEVHLLSLYRLLCEEDWKKSDYGRLTTLLRLRRIADELLGSTNDEVLAALSAFERARNTVAELRAENERLRSEQTVEVFDVDADVVTREQKRPRTEEPPSSALKAVADIAGELSAKTVAVKQERDAATQRANAAEDRLECCVCQDAAHQVMLGPCRHLCCCATCAPALTECPICRTPVESRTAAFF